MHPRPLQTIAIKILGALFINLFLFSNLPAFQSVIADAEGYACTGKKKPTKQARKKALENSTGKAARNSASYIDDKINLNDPDLKKALVEAYSKTDIKILTSKETGWYKDKANGNCFKVSITAEVVPDRKAMEKAAEDVDFSGNPSAPLYVRLWTDKKEYKSREKIKIYFKGNKAFYARILYKDSKGALSQLLPNPYREESRFDAGKVYEIPSDNDKFELEAMPPFKKENITIYAGTAPLGDMDIGIRGSVYRIETAEKDIAAESKKIKLKEYAEGNTYSVSEYFEDNIVISIEKGEAQEVREAAPDSGIDRESSEVER